jgi:hypothetical protein
MQEKSNEFDSFNSAMDTILRTDPKAVKEAMEAEIEATKRERQARGELKRGKPGDRKPGDRRFRVCT